MTLGLVYYPPFLSRATPAYTLQCCGTRERERERERERGEESHAICLRILPGVPARLDRDVERDREVVKIPRGKTRNLRLKCQSLLDATLPPHPFFFFFA